MGAREAGEGTFPDGHDEVVDRRSGLDRRTADAIRAAKRGDRGEGSTGLERRRGPGRRLSDFTKSAEEGEMNREQFLFLMAIDAFKKANGKTFPSWTDVLEVIRLLGYRKTAPMSLRGHLDMVRVLPRVFRRAGLPLFYTEGFSPRPMLAFGPALALGMQSLAEYVDFALTEERFEIDVLKALRAASEEGLGFDGLTRLSESEPGLSKRIDAVGYLVRLPNEPGEEYYRNRLEVFSRAPEFPVEVTRKRKRRRVDAKHVVLRSAIRGAGETAGLWDADSAEPVLELRVIESSGAPSLKPAELVRAMLGIDVSPTAFVRIGCWAREDGRELRDPLELVEGKRERLARQAYCGMPKSPVSTTAKPIS